MPYTTWQFPDRGQVAQIKHRIKKLEPQISTLSPPRQKKIRAAISALYAELNGQIDYDDNGEELDGNLIVEPSHDNQ